MSPFECQDLRTSIRLLREFQAGSQDSLGRLLQRYHHRILRVVRVEIGALLATRVDPEDVVQDVFVAAIQGLCSFEPRSHASLINWFSKVAVNRLKREARYWSAERRALRSTKSLDQLAEDLGWPALASLRSGDPSCDDVDLLGETTVLVDSLISKLPGLQRQVFNLRQLCGMDWDEIVKELSLDSRNSARGLYHRGWTRLKVLAQDHPDLRIE